MSCNKKRLKHFYCVSVKLKYLILFKYPHEVLFMGNAVVVSLNLCSMQFISGVGGGGVCVGGGGGCYT